MKNLGTIIISILSLCATAQVQKGSRTLAIQPDTGENTSYDQVIQESNDLCYETVHLSIPWSYIEEDNGVWNAGNIAAYLDVTNTYYPANGLSIELNISGINTVVLSMPEDLKTLSWDSQTMIDRYKIFLDTVFAHIPDVDITLLNIGNEMDIYYGDNPAAYNEYKIFLDSVKPYAEALYAQTHVDDLDVGCTMTLAGLTDATIASQCASVNASADVISVTYYPLENDFTMSNPDSPIADFNSLMNAYPGTKPIYFAECGYSTSADCNSNETMQADFYTNVFTAWDTHIDRIPTITVFKIIDWSETEAQDLSEDFNLGSNTISKEYLRTLGIRNYTGTSTKKEAYYRLECELESRSWCANSICEADVKENTNDLYSIYPNPTTDYVNFKGNLNALKSVSIIDVNGKLIHRQLGANRIDVRNFETGIYWVQMNYQGGVFYEKLIIK